jgi:hypothetical protein
VADYTKATNFTAKDTLPTGNAGKIVKGTEIDTEFTAISSAIASKANINSPTFTGTPVAPTASVGTNTTQLATTAYVKAEITALSLGNMSTQAKTAVDITGGTIVGITDLAVADGGTGRSTLTANAVLVGNGTSGINSVAPSTSGNVLTSDGTSWTSAANVEQVKAWVNFNGTGTVAIRESFNVSSITDNGTGDYTVNFTTALTDANYATLVSSNNGGADGYIGTYTTYTTSAVQIYALQNGALVDRSYVNVAVFR